jgi:hypothetical protein
MKKNIVLFILFILPIVAYLFFASGINSFAKLPTITKNVPEISSWTTLDDKPIALTGKITILGFIGQDVNKYKGNFFNLYEKIFDRNKNFKDFQMVMILPNGTQEQVRELQKDVTTLGTQAGWNFVFGSPEEITNFYNSLKLVGKLDSKLGTPNVFIIDKKRNLRGRKGHDEKGKPEYKEGYNTKFVSELYNEMTDDVKIILAEYRLALKKNHNATKELIPNEK